MNNILHHIRTGDIASFHTAYKLYHSKLYFYAMKNTRSEYLSQEIVQLTFIKLWEHRQSLSPDIDLPIQLFRIGKSTMIDLLRKESRHLHRHTTISASATAVAENIDPSVKDELRRVYDNMEKMAPVRRKIFQLSRIEGLSHKEIAQRLSISPKTVENHIGRAIRQLREMITLFF